MEQESEPDVALSRKKQPARPSRPRTSCQNCEAFNIREPLHRNYGCLGQDSNCVLLVFAALTMLILLTMVGFFIYTMFTVGKTLKSDDSKGSPPGRDLDTDGMTVADPAVAAPDELRVAAPAGSGAYAPVDPRAASPEGPAGRRGRDVSSETPILTGALTL